MYTCDEYAFGTLDASSSYKLPTAGGTTFFRTLLPLLVLSPDRVVFPGGGSGGRAAIGAAAATLIAAAAIRIARFPSRILARFSASSCVCTGSGSSPLDPAAVAACLPRLGIGDLAV